MFNTEGEFIVKIPLVNAPSTRFKPKANKLKIASVRTLETKQKIQLNQNGQKIMHKVSNKNLQMVLWQNHKKKCMLKLNRKCYYPQEL